MVLLALGFQIFNLFSLIKKLVPLFTHVWLLPPAMSPTRRGGGVAAAPLRWRTIRSLWKNLAARVHTGKKHHTIRKKLLMVKVRRMSCDWRRGPSALPASPLLLLVTSRCLMVSTNQADPGCFYLRISWILMERCWFYFFRPLHLVQGLRSNNIK